MDKKLADHKRVVKRDERDQDDAQEREDNPHETCTCRVSMPAFKICSLPRILSSAKTFV
jgi:hypothetical protein